MAPRAARTCCAWMSFLKRDSSFTMLRSCSSCLWIASLIAASASSRRAIASSDDRHCAVSCRFSKWIASISCSASTSVSVAARVSAFCASTCMPCTDVLLAQHSVCIYL